MTGHRIPKRSVCTLALGLFFTVAPVRASILLDTGSLTFSATGTQTDRLLRTGQASIWAVSKPFPGVIGDALPRGYEVFTLLVGNKNFLQINFDDPKNVFFDAAYAGAFTPNATAPFYGLDAGYLGDPGITQPFQNPNSFQVVVPRNSTVAIAINELDPGAGAGEPFRLQVEGFLDSGFNDTPEPAAILLCGSGLAGLVVARRLPRRERSVKAPHRNSV